MSGPLSKRQDASTPSERLWMRFVRLYNKRAAKLSLPRIATLSALARREPIISEAEAERLRADLFTDLFDDAYPLAARWFDLSRKQSEAGMARVIERAAH